MNKIAIIIPSRLKAKRLENKPLKLINNKEMILHVYEAATKSKSGEVYVATPDEEIIKVVKKFGGNVSKTAKFVGMERSALHRKLKDLGVKDLN